MKKKRGLWHCTELPQWNWLLISVYTFFCVCLCACRYRPHQPVCPTGNEIRPAGERQDIIWHAHDVLSEADRLVARLRRHAHKSRRRGKRTVSGLNLKGFIPNNWVHIKKSSAHDSGRTTTGIVLMCALAKKDSHRERKRRVHWISFFFFHDVPWVSLCTQQALMDARGREATQTFFFHCCECAVPVEKRISYALR